MYTIGSIEADLLESAIKWDKQKRKFLAVPLNVAIELVSKLKKQSITWTAFDFESRAIDRVGIRKWKKIYDASKFELAIEIMLKEHDCNIGINWDVVDYYLDEFCAK